jgi:hypothetical protein
MGIFCSIINAVPVLNDIELLDGVCLPGEGLTPAGDVAIIVFFFVSLFFR